MPSDPLTIAGPHLGFDPQSPLGGERYEAGWLRAMTSPRLQFHWVVREGMPGASPESLPPNHHVKLIAPARGLRRISAEAAALRALDRKLGLSLIRLHSLHYGAPTALALRTLRVTTPLLVQHHHVEEPARKYARRARLLARLGAHFASVSRTANDELVAIGVPRAQTTVIRSVLPAWNPAHSNLALKTKIHDYDLVSVGGLIARKRPGLVLETAAELQKLLNRPVRVALIGRGELEGELKRQAASLGVKAELFTSCDDKAKWDLLARSRVFLFTSAQEGFGYAPLEAALAGLWVLSSDAGSLGEILSGFPAATLVPPVDMDSRRLAAAARERLDARPAPLADAELRSWTDTASWAAEHERLLAYVASRPKRAAP